MEKKLETFINRFIYRRKMEDIILGAEMAASKSGADHIEMLEEYGSSFKKTDDELSKRSYSLAKKLSAGGKRWTVYKDYLDNDVLMLLKIGADKNITAGRMIEDYMPIKRIIADFRNTIRSNLLTPIVVTFIAIFILGYINTELKKNIDSGFMKVSEFSYMLMDNFYLFNFTMAIAFTVILFAFPKYVPVLNKVYRELDSMQALSLVNTLLKVNHHSVEIIPIIKSQFKIEHVPRRNDMEGLIEVLLDGKLITIFEAAEIRVSAARTSPQRAISLIVEERKKVADRVTQIAGSIVSVAVKLLLTSPVLFTLSMFNALLQGAIAMSQGVGG